MAVSARNTYVLRVSWVISVCSALMLTADNGMTALSTFPEVKDVKLKTEVHEHRHCPEL